MTEIQSANALREAQWDISILQTERDAAIASALMPLREALQSIEKAENLIAARDCARHALDVLDPERVRALSGSRAT